MSQVKSAILFMSRRATELQPTLMSLLLIACVLAGVPSPVLAQAPRSPTPASVKGVVDVQTIAKGSNIPGASLSCRTSGCSSPNVRGACAWWGRTVGSPPLTGVPQVYASGQGGLLDVALSPTFDQDRLVYLSFAESGEGGARTAVARGRLGERGLENTQVIWRQQPKVGGSNHWGSRIVFRPDGTLFVTLGERFNHSESPGSICDARQSRAHQSGRLGAAR